MTCHRVRSTIWTLEARSVGHTEREEAVSDERTTPRSCVGEPRLWQRPRPRSPGRSSRPSPACGSFARGVGPERLEAARKMWWAGGDPAPAHLPDWPEDSLGDRFCSGTVMAKAAKAPRLSTAAVPDARVIASDPAHWLSLIHISEPTRLGMISYAVFC